VTEQALLREFQSQLERHPALRDGAPRRRGALAALESVGFPTPRRENWRYTDLKSVAGSPFDFAPPAPSSADVAAARERLAAAPLGLEAERFVLVDGHPAAELCSSGATARVEVLSGGSAAGAGEERVREHALSSLNAAFAQHEIRVRVGAGERPSVPLELVLVASGRQELAPQPRVAIELEKGAELAVVLRLVDCGAPAHWINSVVRIEQAAGSRLAFHRLQEHGHEQAHTGLLAATLAADAQLAVAFVDLGGRLIRNDIDVRLAEAGAAVEMFGVFLAAGGQHVDDHTRIDHIGQRTRSDETFRGIIGERGRGVFNGKVVVHRAAHGTDARQSNDNLLLGEHGEIDTKPELEIYADDVKCSHGSTVGELDTDQLFYMRSRGIDEPSARRLLTVAFASSVLERIADEKLRAAFAERVTARLHDLTEKAS
jgi:Fe-S cluster assembly protein SufD